MPNYFIVAVPRSEYPHFPLSSWIKSSNVIVERDISQRRNKSKQKSPQRKGYSLTMNNQSKLQKTGSTIVNPIKLCKYICMVHY